MLLKMYHVPGTVTVGGLFENIAKPWKSCSGMSEICSSKNFLVWWGNEKAHVPMDIDKAVSFEEGECFPSQGSHVGLEVSGQFTAQLCHVPVVADKSHILLEPHVLSFFFFF